MSPIPQPSWSSREKNVHLSYELPHRVHGALVYPFAAPNSSSIIIYGHDEGLTVLWRGGKSLRPPPERIAHVQPRSQLSASNQDVMILDSDDEEPKSVPDASADGAAYDSEEEEFDATTPFEHIVAQLDIDLDSAVLHLATISSPSRDLDVASQQIPPILNEKVLLAIACADSSTRLITFDLKPPTQSLVPRHSNGKDYTEILLSRGLSGSQLPCRGIAITWTSQRSSTSTSDTEMSEDQQSENYSGSSFGKRGTRTINTIANAEEDIWEILVAAHSPDLAGLLSIWQMPVPAGKNFQSLSRKPVLPSQTHYLSSPAISIAFNTSACPSRRHSHLIIADSRGIVRIYDPLPASGFRSSRSAVGTTGTWLATFCVPFRDDSKANGPSQRMKVIDAQWALNGRSILVLLDNGEWGIWDISGAGPTVGKIVSPGVTGGGVTSFAIHGSVGDEVISKAPLHDASKGLSTRETKIFAPMTPKTRKVRQKSLFTGPSKSSGLARGGISLCPILHSPSATTNDESLLIWFRSAIYSVPSLMTYWQRVATGGSGHGGVVVQSGTLYGPSINQLATISTSGEAITSIAQLPSKHKSNATKPGGLLNNLLFSAEHRLVMLCSPKTTQDLSAKPRATAQPRLGAFDSHTVKRVDQDLLSKGNLDLGGVDRMLESMESGRPSFYPFKVSTLAPRGRKVDFAAGF